MVDLIDFINTDTDALWLHDERYLFSSGSFQFLAENAWTQRILVISSVPGLVKRGTPIGLEPNVEAIAQALITQAESLAERSVSSTENKPRFSGFWVPVGGWVNPAADQCKES